MRDSVKNLVQTEVSGANLQILIIDDEHEICEEISEKLEFHGFECLVAKDSKTGLALIRSNRDISIVLTDIRMPGMSGLEMCKVIGSEVSEGRELALLVMTGHAGLSEAIESLKVGALDFLTKPLSPDLLIHAVKRADQYIRAQILKRDFNKALRTQVELMTVDLKKKNFELETSNIALTTSNQVKEEFLRMINHELRTPLSAIIGLADIMMPDIDDPQKSEFLDNIKNAGWQLLNIINSMIDMVALDAKTLQLEKDDVDVSIIIEQAVAAYSDKAEKSGVTINRNNVSRFRFKLDPIRISQAIGYLIDNAINFSTSGCIVYVSSKKTDVGLTISIQDNGDGMSPLDVEKALEPLRQVDGSLAREHGGIGLGLSLSNLFIDLHGGAIEIISKVGHGTNVIITIPEEKD